MGHLYINSEEILKFGNLYREGTNSCTKCYDCKNCGFSSLVDLFDPSPFKCNCPSFMGYLACEFKFKNFDKKTEVSSVETEETKNTLHYMNKNNLKQTLEAWGWNDKSYDYVQKFCDGTETICNSRECFENYEGDKIFFDNKYITLKGKHCDVVEVAYENIYLESADNPLSEKYGKDIKEINFYGSGANENLVLAKIKDPMYRFDVEEDLVIFRYEITNVIRSTTDIYASSRDKALKVYRDNIGSGLERETICTESEEIECVNEYYEG